MNVLESTCCRLSNLSVTFGAEVVCSQQVQQLFSGLNIFNSSRNQKATEGVSARITIHVLMGAQVHISTSFDVCFILLKGFL